MLINAVKNGLWSSIHTWENRVVPADNDSVNIPSDKEVILDTNTARLDQFTVQGRFILSKDKNTSVIVHTWQTDPGSYCDLGTYNDPVEGSFVCTFTDGDFLSSDWKHLGRGFVCMGSVDICGLEITHAVRLSQPALPNSNTLVLDETPFGWKVGDKVLLPGTHVRVEEEEIRYQDEWFTILSINNNVVVLDSQLVYLHCGAEDIPHPQLINLTRNVVFKSENPEKRGHIMFMNPNCHAKWGSCIDLGRTDKSFPVTDPRLDSNGNIVSGSQDNIRARYAIHWHRTAGSSHSGGSRFDSNGNGSIVSNLEGWVVEGSPGWGIVNHVANVHVKKCVVVDAFGAGFTTEEGDEAGFFEDCIAVHCLGLGVDESRNLDDKGDAGNADWGINGDGFWLQGPLVEIRNCNAYTCSGVGFNVVNFQFSGRVKLHLDWHVTLEPNRLPEPFNDGDWLYKRYHPGGVRSPGLGEDGNLLSHHCPVQGFKYNRAYACQRGLQFWTDEPSKIATTAHTTVNGISACRCIDQGAHFEYAKDHKVVGMIIHGDRKEVEWFFSQNLSKLAVETRGRIEISRFIIRGYGTAIVAPTHSTCILHEGEFKDCETAIELTEPDVDDPRGLIIKEVLFTSVPKHIRLAWYKNIQGPDAVHLAIDPSFVSYPIKVDTREGNLNGQSGVLNLTSGEYIFTLGSLQKIPLTISET